MIARKVSVRDDTIFLQALQLENPTASRLIFPKNQIDRHNSKDRDYFFLRDPKFSLPPNGPELSCGGEAPQRRNPVRAS
jgi:hypothetical protein